MPNNLPLVSIVTSTYKHENYLRQTIESVLSQDYKNIEYLVINDGSPDGTEEILKSYGNLFYWETQKNMGETPTLNKVIRKAKGEFVAKLSSDDYLYPYAISEMVDRFLRNPELVVVYSDFDLIDEFDNKFLSVQKPDYNFIDTIKDHLCLPGPGALFRKNIFDQVGGFDPQFRILFDMHFWWRAGLLGPFVRVPKPLSAFRQHRLSQSSSGGDRMAEETIRCVNHFYSLKRLPRNVSAVKGMAFSNAYYSAAMQYSQGHSDKTICKEYLRKSFLYSPFNYFRPKNRSKLINFIDVMVSPKLVPSVKKIFTIIGADK